MSQSPTRMLKDPVCLLMEYAAKTKTKVEFTEPVREGPDHSPQFVVSSIISGQTLRNGSGTNKKAAKKEAAKIALRALMGDRPKNGQQENGQENGESYQNGYDSEEDGCKDPVSELMEHAHAVKATVDFTEIIRCGPDHKPAFCTSAVVDGLTYAQGRAGTKRQAKKEASKLALVEIMRQNGLRTPSSESSQDDMESIKSAGSIDGKHPTSALMEFAQSRNIQVTFLPPEVEGPDHIRRYSTAVVVRGKVLPRGTGVSIKDAKKDAAFKALELLSDWSYFNQILRTKVNGRHRIFADKSSKRMTPMMRSVLDDFKDKDPICALQEYCVPRRLTVNYIEHPAVGPSHQPTFTIACSVAGKIYSNQNSNQKQTAKKEAARIALATILSKAQQRLEEANRIAARNVNDTLNQSATWEDYVAAHSHKILEIVQDAQRDKFVKEKVLATVIVRKSSEDDGTIVSLGTGNRCILGKHLTDDGRKVHHSHAEVIARRGFVRYLYQQLKTYEKGKPHGLFQESSSGKLRLKRGATVHLYISRPPCGDASAFIDISNNPSKQRAVRRQGLLRTIMEDGEGAIPCTSEPVEATFDQLRTGDKRLRVMTCSDKICRWNLLGLQGALLSHFLDTVYLTSVTVGSFRGQQLHHLPRAVSGRLEGCMLDGYSAESYLPKAFKVNHPIVGSVSDSSADVYDLPNSRQYSINWCDGDTTVEVVDGMSGEKVVGQGPEAMSRVSKRALYEHFTQVLPRRRNKIVKPTDCYTDAKEKATDYGLAKSVFIQWLAQLGCGPWIHLPQNADDFSVS